MLRCVGGGGGGFRKYNTCVMSRNLLISLFVAIMVHALFCLMQFIDRKEIPGELHFEQYQYNVSMNI